MTKLGIDGDDAYELILMYEKEFHVDLSKFLYSDYFNSEGFGLLWVSIDPQPKKGTYFRGFGERNTRRKVG